MWRTCLKMLLCHTYKCSQGPAQAPRHVRRSNHLWLPPPQVRDQGHGQQPHPCLHPYHHFFRPMKGSYLKDSAVIMAAVLIWLPHERPAPTSSSFNSIWCNFTVLIMTSQIISWVFACTGFHPVVVNRVKNTVTWFLSHFPTGCKKAPVPL